MSAQPAKPSNLKRTELLGAAVVAWQIYELMPGGEAPSRAVLTLHYVFLACGLIASIGSLLMLAKQT